MSSASIRRKFAASAVFLASGYASVTALAADIRVGVVLDHYGPNADAGRDYIAGARTWFDHVNANGGVRGRRIHLIVKDDEGNPATAAKLTGKLIDQDKVEALFGYVGDDSLAAVTGDARFRASKTVLFAPMSGLDLGSAVDPVVFVRPSYKDEVHYALRHFGLLSVSRFAVVYADNKFGRSLGAEVRAKLAADQNKPVVEVAIPLALAGLTTAARNVLNAKPEVIIVAADTLATAEFVKQARRLDSAAQIVAFSNVNHRTLWELTKADFATGTMMTQVVPNPLSNATKLQKDHLNLLAKYRDEPPSHLTLEGFLAAKGFVKLLERAGRDVTRASIATSIAGTRRYDLDGMSLSFGGKNERASRFVDIAFLRESGTLLQ